MDKYNQLYQSLFDQEDIFSNIEVIQTMAIDFFPNILHRCIHERYVTKKIEGQVNDLIDYYTTHSSETRFWKNPELFKCLVDFSLQKDTSSQKNLLNLIGMQLGIEHEPVATTKHLATRFFYYQKCYFFHENKFELNETNHFLVHKMDNTQILTVCLPLKNAFTGFISEDIYPTIFSTKGTVDEMKLLIENSLSILQKYSPGLYNDLFETISYVFLTPDFGDSIRFSYNLRTQYFGAIFINPFQTNEVAFAESLIHELIHQRIWMQWAYNMPDLHEYEQIRIESPVTNRLKSLPVMTQAYIIYNVLYDFNLFLVSENIVSGARKKKTDTAIQHLQKNIPFLYSRLTDAAIDAPELSNLIGRVHALTNTFCYEK
ncbi:hypothetical protein HB364_17980 [Pseudoflavitalea sp. X16]|uniref:hypothetical protein n=1 Tax=Paraflavitalea devenefica TaxID=2716334 RepID=UPI0014222725|nr:hypothetical protein [Paraflavitalea devenefica]NII26985.1 hypothetical protein [Paraflavitalea devenefica]